MSEMNNVTVEETTTVSKSKPNWIIFIFSWVIAVALLVVGIISLDSSKELSLYTVSTIEDVEENETYEFTYTPSSSDTYYFFLKGATLDSITYGDGHTKAINYVGPSGSYRVYKVSLTSDKTYTFMVDDAFSSTISAKITDQFDDDNNSSSSSSSYYR